MARRIVFALVVVGVLFIGLVLAAGYGTFGQTDGAGVIEGDTRPSEVQRSIEQAVQQAQDLRAEAQQRLEEAQAQAQDAVDAAEARVEQLRAEAEQRLQEAKEQAIEAAKTARNAAIWSALFLSISSLIAGLAAWMGAIRGGSDRDAGRVWAGLKRRH